MYPSDNASVIVENYKGKNDRKSVRKQKRAYYRLLRDMNIKCSNDPTQVCLIIICSAFK